MAVNDHNSRVAIMAASLIALSLTSCAADRVESDAFAVRDAIERYGVRNSESTQCESLSGATRADYAAHDYQDIGPGDFVLLGNTEMRFPLFWIVGGGLFLDGGNAWESVRDVRWQDFRPTSAGDDPERAGETDVRYSVGIGLRVATPVGPVRFDVARKLKLLPVAEGETSSENRWDYEISLGHVF